MDAIDWNWFYSSLAQSSAAIVGFIGGFIALKILELSSKKSHIEWAYPDGRTRQEKLDEYWKENSAFFNHIRSGRSSLLGLTIFGVVIPLAMIPLHPLLKPWAWVKLIVAVVIFVLFIFFLIHVFRHIRQEFEYISKKPQ